MKALGVIPARFQSSRFPGKPLIDLNGKSMIQHVYERVEASSLFEKVIVATDDARIYKHVSAFGNVCMTNAHHSSGTERCAEVALQYPEMEVVVNIQGDEPLVEVKQLKELLSLLTSEEVTIASLCHPDVSQEDFLNPNRIKVVTNFRNEALYFSRSGIPNDYHASKNCRTPLLRHIGLYGFKRTTLLELVQLPPCDLELTESLEQLRWLYNGFVIKMGLTEIETPNIDTPEDVEKVLRLMAVRK
jgi:3-deoxy-manno-octulosonate cytidylyltransferase (CMP-KDO synthetase)